LFDDDDDDDTTMMMMHLSTKFFKNYDYYRMQVPARQLSAMHHFWQNKKWISVIPRYSGRLNMN